MIRNVKQNYFPILEKTGSWDKNPLIFLPKTYIYEKWGKIPCK